MKLSISRFAKYAWGVLAYNVFVILVGAFVRATGSGAGCGAHWPLCNGVVIPRPERIETLIEFSHRLTSGLTLPLILILLIWAWRTYPRRNPIRITSALAMVFIITEALVGAGLVLFQLVAKDTSVYRAVTVMVHLVNTFLLIASLTLTAWWATDGAPEKLHLQGAVGTAVLIGGLAILLLGASGAVTALGDTLYPSSSVQAGIQEDFSPTAHYLIRMRVYHPGIAVSVGLYLALVTFLVRRSLEEPRLELITLGLFSLYGLQILLGITNIALLAPVWMQLVHLLTSNLVWIAFLLMAAVVFGSAHRVPRLVHHEAHHRVNEPKEVR